MKKKKKKKYKPVRVNNICINNYIEYESNVERNKTLSVEEYLDKLDHVKKSQTWKIQLTIANNFITSIGIDEERVMHSKCDNIEIMINNETDEVIKEFLDSLKNRYQNNLESIKGSKFVVDYVH